MDPAAFPPPDPSTVAVDPPVAEAPPAGARPVGPPWTPAPTPPPTAPPAPRPSIRAPYSSLLYLPDPRIRWGLGTAVLTLVGIVVPLATLIVLFGLGVLPYSPALVFAGSLGSYLLALLVPVLASRLRGLGSLAADLGLRFRWIDIPIGIGLGISVRILVFMVLIALGPLLGDAQSNIELEPDPVWFVLTSVLIPVVVAPVVEEILCRGVVMRAVRNRMLRPGRRRGTGGDASAVPSARRRSAALVLSIVLSTLVFAALHGHQMVNVATVVTLGATTVIAGVAHGWIATATGRLGAAIISHATLNGSAVLLVVFVESIIGG